MDTTNTNYSGMSDLIALMLLAGVFGFAKFPGSSILGKFAKPEADPGNTKEIESKLKELNCMVAGALRHMEAYSIMPPSSLDMEVSRICSLANDIAISCKVRSEIAKATPPNSQS